MRPLPRYLLLPVLVTTLLCLGTAAAQTDGLQQINDPVHLFLLRQYTAGRLPGAYLVHQPISTYESRRYLDSVAAHIDELNAVELALLRKYRGGTEWLKNPERTRFPRLFRNGTDFLSHGTEDYSVQMNPLLYMSAGYARRSLYDTDAEQLFAWQNTRGLRFSGSIGEHVFFETRIEENQRIPSLPDVRKKTAPRVGNVKYGSEGEVPGRTTPYDYFLATGVVGLRSRFIEARFGRDRNLWGIGRSSLQLSNYSTVYDQLQIRTTLGRFQYTNLFTAFTDLTGLPEAFALDRSIPLKYGALHRLSLAINDRMQIGVFEGVVFAPDSVRQGFELSFLNPVIFYRAVESDRGSAGNVILGGDFQWLVRPGFLTYTQFIVDEFRIKELQNPGRGWWGNKWGWTFGVHIIDPLPFVANSSLRAEYTRTRPFTYSHRTADQGYEHYGDFLAHPAGPNSEDVAFFLTFQPTPRILAELNLSATVRGRNGDVENVGADPGVPYTSRDGDFGHRLLQGIPENHVLLEFHAGYEILPMVFLEAVLQAEHFRDGELGTQWHVSPVATLRWGLPFQSVRY